MSDRPSNEKQVSGPKYLSLPWLITLVAAFGVLVPVAGAVAQEVGGWLGWVIWFVVWGVMCVVAWIVTNKYANPKLPLICGVMMGVTAPRPSDVWLRQVAGEGWGKAIDMAITMIGVVVGMTIFNAIAKRRKSSSAK
jgi:D-alanyl-lipoteichoic acid acyltransferase DltB (MBOAT superfamily)